MALVLYNTATRRKEIFSPLDPDNVRMYVCGPTAYDTAHIGNARPVIVFDVLYRLLKDRFESVRYVRNITDVDDKIIDAAAENGEAIDALTARTIGAFHDDVAALNTLEPDVEPRATEHIGEMIAMIEKLIAGDHAYSAAGHVLFEVAKMADYGKLSGRDRREQVAGARVEVAPYKRDPADFVLWKPSLGELPGWPSPWGRGRPGWHIECSAMSEKHLGATFDIHGGGRDLIFPHHENEVAQSTCVHGPGSFAQTWLHNGFVTVDGEKMSKSLGNVVTVRELMGRWPAEAIRLNMLSAHYRQPLDWTEDGVRNAKRTLDRWYRTIDDAGEGEGGGEGEGEGNAGFVATLEDDLNTPKAIAEMHRLDDEVSLSSGNTALEKKRALKRAGNLLGLLGRETRAWFVWRPPGAALDEAGIQSHVVARQTARARRQFAEADRIRDALAAEGVVLEDKPDGTTAWRHEG